MYHNILVPISFDAERDSSAALKLAELLSTPEAAVTLLHVVEHIPEYAISYMPAEYLSEARKAIQTELDALAARGAMFTQYRTSPLCSPTRAMLLTGLDNHETGVWPSGWRLQCQFCRNAKAEHRVGAFEDQSNTIARKAGPASDNHWPALCLNQLLPLDVEPQSMYKSIQAIHYRRRRSFTMPISDL